MLASASAAGFYGDTGTREVGEDEPAGTGFLADVCRQWEDATRPAATVGTRVTHLRTGLVLAPHGGMMGRIKPLFAIGAGGKLGSGSQYWPWISLADEIAAIEFLLNRPIGGPVNLTGPAPVTNAEFTRTLGRLMHRPTVASVPAVALRAVLGGFADSGVLVSQRVVPEVLLRDGFEFRHRSVDEALRWALTV